MDLTHAEPDTHTYTHTVYRRYLYMYLLDACVRGDVWGAEMCGKIEYTKR